MEPTLLRTHLGEGEGALQKLPTLLRATERASVKYNLAAIWEPIVAVMAIFKNPPQLKRFMLTRSLCEAANRQFPGPYARSRQRQMGIPCKACWTWKQLMMGSALCREGAPAPHLCPEVCVCSALNEDSLVRLRFNIMQA